MKHYEDETTLDEMASVLCHDLGSPSRALRQYLVMLKHARDQNDDAAMDKWLDRMSSVLDRLDERLDNVMSISQRGTATAHDGVDPSAQIEALSDAMDVSITIASTDTWPLSERESHTVLEEVLKNVRDHGGGQATIRMANGRLDCADTGPGVSCDPKDVFLVFRPVHPATSNNRGLGLARASQIVRNAGGVIRLSCPEDGGTITSIDFTNDR